MRGFRNGFPEIILTAILYCFCPCLSEARDISDTLCNERLLEYTEQVYGPDDFIIQGRLYKIRNREANGNPFFMNDAWNLAVIFSYGRQYRGIPIRYDIETDEIVMRVTHGPGTTNFVSSEYAAIDSFMFDGHMFVNLRKINDSIGEEGYYEKIFHGKRWYLLKHEKQWVKNYNAINPHGAFSSQISTFSLINNNQLVSFSGRKSFLHYFNGQKKEIRNFMRQHHIHFRRAGKDDFIKLSRYVDKIAEVIK